MEKTFKAVREQSEYTPSNTAWWVIVGLNGRTMKKVRLCYSEVKSLFYLPSGNVKFVVSTEQPSDDDEYHTLTRLPYRTWQVTGLVDDYDSALIANTSAYLTRQFPGVFTLYVTMYGD